MLTCGEFERGVRYVVVLREIMWSSCKQAQIGGIVEVDVVNSRWGTLEGRACELCCADSSNGRNVASRNRRQGKWRREVKLKSSEQDRSVIKMRAKRVKAKSSDHFKADAPYCE